MKMRMVIGDILPPPTPGWDPDPTAQDRYSISLTFPANSPDASVRESAFSALQRYLPSNVAATEANEETDDFDIPVDAFSCDNFRMFEFKVKRCARARAHDWTECPFAHPGEKARRRDPRRHHYSGTACAEFRKGECMRGDACENAHGVFECWLHPARYRTQLCKDGTHCRRRVCFFAHSPDQLRILPQSTTPDSFYLHGSSPKSIAPYSPPESPPISPGSTLSLSQLSESMRVLKLCRSRMGPNMKQTGLNPGIGATKPSPGFRFPFGVVTACSGLGSGETSKIPCQEEPMIERVESGKALREKLYAKLVEENSLNRVG